MYSATLPGDIFVLQTQINTQEAEVKHTSSSCRWHARPLQQDRCQVRFAQTDPGGATRPQQRPAPCPCSSGGKDQAGAGPERPPMVTVTPRDSHSAQPAGEAASRTARRETRPSPRCGETGTPRTPAA